MTYHYHPNLYPSQAWSDEGCPQPRTAVALPDTDERVRKIRGEHETLET